MKGSVEDYRSSSMGEGSRWGFENVPPRRVDKGVANRPSFSEMPVKTLER